MSLKTGWPDPLIRGLRTTLRSAATLLFLTAVMSCAKPAPIVDLNRQTLFVAEGDTPLHVHAPSFVIDQPPKDYNLIGTPTATLQENGNELIFIDPSKATLYAEERSFQTARGDYRNLIYRVHFEKVPARHLVAGKNIGLIVVVTLNRDDQPVLLTVVHTCGCYLGIIPTSYLDDAALPEGWDRTAMQNIYGEQLPGNLDFGDSDLRDTRIMLLLADGTHRASNVWLQAATELPAGAMTPMALAPLDSLNRLKLANGGTTSFFETEGSRKGLVKGSSKPWERLFMSWWALAWNIGVDKKLGVDATYVDTFYTSLKPWARDDSDMRDFRRFLEYWGWKL